jgi:uncharacterized protein YecA (UPF0149 family)
MDQKQLLEMFNVIQNNLTEEQLKKLEQLSQKINPNNMNQQQSLKIIKDLGIDLKDLQKQARKERIKNNSDKPKKIKIGRNELCNCGSGKKSKKCCNK